MLPVSPCLPARPGARLLRRRARLLRPLPVFVVAAALGAVLSAALAGRGAIALAEPAIEFKPLPADSAKSREKQTQLPAREEKEVRKALSDYLSALQKQDFKEAGTYLDRESFLKQVDPMVKSIASDSIHVPVAMRMIFGVSTRDSLEATPTPALFAALMRYLEETSPASTTLLARAQFEILGARKLGERVHVAYQLTIPPDTPGGTPFVHVTADELRKVDGRWVIVFKASD